MERVYFWPHTPENVQHARRVARLLTAQNTAGRQAIKCPARRYGTRKIRRRGAIYICLCAVALEGAKA